MTKPERLLGFEALEYHQYIRRNVNLNKYKSKKDEKVVKSPSLSYFCLYTDDRSVIYQEKDNQKIQDLSNKKFRNCE